MSENGCQYEERVGLTGSDFFLRTKGMLIFRIFHVEFDDDHSQVLCLLCVELSA
jgi:hypothetical protein